jgi:AcrR family transcriptional regulator
MEDLVMAESDESDLLTLAFELLAERGWERFSFVELSRRASLPLAEVYAQLPDRAALLRVLGRRLDAEMLAIDMAELDGMSPRERVFELIMRRLDAMAPYRASLRSLARRTRPEPTLVLAACCNLSRLSRRLVDAAGVDGGPVMQRMARRATGAVYLQTFRVWLDDDTPDMARTLAELDRRLQQAESVARWFNRFCRFSAHTAESQVTA